MPKPSPKPQPIGQNADGTFIYGAGVPSPSEKFSTPIGKYGNGGLKYKSEPGQNMSTMPDKPWSPPVVTPPKNPITTGSTGIPNVGVPNIMGLGQNSIAPNVGFSGERASQINEQAKQPVNDTLKIRERTESNQNSERTKLLSQHFGYLKEKGLFELNDKQNEFIQSFKGKHPEYKSINDTALYSKLLLSDEKVGDKYGNIGEKTFLRRVFELPFNVAKSGGESVNLAMDSYNSWTKAFEGNGDKYGIIDGTPNAFLAGGAVLLGATEGAMMIFGDVLNLGIPRGKYEVTSTTELLSRNVGKVMVGTMNVIDMMSADGEGYTEGQIKDIVAFLDKNPKTEAIAKSIVLGYSNLIGVGVVEGVVTREALEKSVLKVIEKEATKTLGFIKKGPVSKAVFEAGMNRSIKEDVLNIPGFYKEQRAQNAAYKATKESTENVAEGGHNAVTPSGETFFMEDKPGLYKNTKDKILYKDDEDLAFRAVSPRQKKATTPKQNKEAGARSLESIHQMYEDSRTGRISSNISTMEGGAEAIDQGLAHWGSKIGEMTRGGEMVQVTDLTDSLKLALTDPKTKLNKDLRGLAETALEVLGDDKYISGISIEELQTVMSDIKGQIFADRAKVAALSRETAGRSLSKFLDDLGARFDDAIESSTGDIAGLKGAKAAYGKYKRIQQDFLNSYLVQQRSVKGGLSNLAGTTMGIMELLKNPTPAGITKAIALKYILQEIGISKSRGGAFDALIRSLDRKALSSKLPENVPNNLFNNISATDNKMGKGPKPVKNESTPTSTIPVNETSGQNLAKVTEIKKLNPEDILKRYNELTPTEKLKARDASDKVNEVIQAKEAVDEIGEFKGDFGYVEDQDIKALSFMYSNAEPDTKAFIRKNLDKTELTKLQEINRNAMGKKPKVEPVEPVQPVHERIVREPGKADYERAVGTIDNPTNKSGKAVLSNMTAGKRGRRGVIVPDKRMADTKALPPGSPVWKQMEDGAFQDPKGYNKALERDLMKDKPLGLSEVWDNGSMKTSDELFTELNARGIVNRDQFIELMLNKEDLGDVGLLKLLDDFEKTNEWTNIQYADEIAEMNLSDTEIGLFRTQFGDIGDDILDSVRYMHKSGAVEVTGEIGKNGKRSKYLTRLEDATNAINDQKGTDYTPDELFNIASEYLDSIRKRKGKFQTMSQRKAEAPEISVAQAREIMGEDFPVSIVDSLETPEGRKAMGMYYQGAIEIANNPSSTTGYHEAFHAWVDMNTTDNEMRAAYNQIKKEKGFTSNAAAEEYLAEAFAEYKLVGKGSYTGKVKQFFERMWNDIKKIIGKQDDVISMFGEVGNTGKVRGEFGKKPVQAFQSEKYQTVDTLETQAKKYKSAEEFVKGHSENLYRGGKAEEILDFNRVPTHNSTTDVKGVYFSKNKVSANDYATAGNRIDSAVIRDIKNKYPKNGELADLIYKHGNDGWAKFYEKNGGPREAIKILDSEGIDANNVADVVAYIDGTRSPAKIDGGGLFNPNMQTLPEPVLKKLSELGIDNKTTKKLHEYALSKNAKLKRVASIKDANKAQSEGYDGIIFDGKTTTGEEVFIFNKDVIKTKSQLADIWNKANK